MADGEPQKHRLACSSRQSAQADSMSIYKVMKWLVSLSKTTNVNLDTHTQESLATYPGLASLERHIVIFPWLIASKVRRIQHKELKKKVLRAILKAQATNLIRRFKTKMLLVKPVLTYTALYHLYLLVNIRIRIGPTACAVWTSEVMIIRVFSILNIFIWEKFAEHFPELWISTVTPKVSLGPEFHDLVPIEQ